MVESVHLNQAVDAYPKMHELLCTLIKQSALEVLLEKDSWKKDGQLLAIKLVQHLNSLYQIAHITELEYPQLKIEFVDFSAVNVLTRAVVETFIVYAYIYKPDDLALARYRHNTWELGGLIDRQFAQASDLSQQEKLSQEKQRIDVLSAAIRESPFFDKSGKRLLKGEWRGGRSWEALGVDAGLHPRWIKHVYSHLSGHAHTSYISTLQIGQAPLVDQKWLADISLSIGLEIMAHFAAIFLKNGKAAARYITENEGAQRLINFWKFTVDDFDNVYGSFAPKVMRPMPVLKERFSSYVSDGTLFWKQ